MRDGPSPSPGPASCAVFAERSVYICILALRRSTDGTKTATPRWPLRGVRWQAVTHVLRYAHPRVRHHIGALLRIAGYDRDGGLLAVTLIEEADDQYLVVSARYLEGAEREAVDKLLSGGKR